MYWEYFVWEDEYHEERHKRRKHCFSGVNKGKNWLNRIKLNVWVDC